MKQKEAIERVKAEFEASKKETAEQEARERSVRNQADRELQKELDGWNHGVQMNKAKQEQIQQRIEAHERDLEESMARQRDAGFVDAVAAMTPVLGESVPQSSSKARPQNDGSNGVSRIQQLSRGSSLAS